MNFEYLFASDDFSYANPDDRLIKKIIIRSIERISGQPHLKRMYEDFRHEPSNESFWDAAIAKLEITLKGHGLPLESVPAEGPIVFIAIILMGFWMEWRFAGLPKKRDLILKF